MVQAFRALLAIALLCVASLASAASTVETYATLSFWESPVQALRPESRISAAEAKARNHFRVLRDEQGRITEFSYRLGDEIRDIEGFFGSLYLSAPLTRIRYEGATETHTFFNRFGHQIEAAGRYQSVYQLDRFGRYQSLRYQNAKGEPAANSWGAQAYRWEYPADGSVIEERFDAQGLPRVHRRGFEFMRIRMVFDPRGHLALMQNIDAAGKLLNSKSGAAQYRYFYDDLGRFIRWEIYDAAGQPALGPTKTAGEENRYQGNELESITFFGLQGEPVLHDSGAARWLLQHDRFGNTTQVSYLGLKDEPVRSSYGVGQTRYHFSEDGRFLTSTAFHDIDGKPLADPEWGFAKTRITRDPRGLMRQLEYLDINGKRVNRRDTGVAYQTFEHDAQGVRTATLRFDGAGKPVPMPGSSRPAPRSVAP